MVLWGRTGAGDELYLLVFERGDISNERCLTRVLSDHRSKCHPLAHYLFSSPDLRPPFLGTSLPSPDADPLMRKSSSGKGRTGGGVKDRGLFDDDAARSSGIGGGGDRSSIDSLGAISVHSFSGSGSVRSSSLSPEAASASPQEEDKNGSFSPNGSIPKPRREVINWNNLDLYTVRRHVLVRVGGKS